MKKIFSIFLSVLTVFTLCFNVKVNVNAEGTYKVTSRATNCTFNGNSEVNDGEEYKFSITPATNYGYPSGLTVKVGDNELSTSDYEYDSSKGKGTIPGEKVKGNIHIVATSDGKSFGVPTVNITNGTYTNNTETTNKEAKYLYQCKLTLTANEGFTLPSSITVKIGGNLYTGFSYSSETGELLISGEAITGAVTVTAVCQSNSGVATYAVTNTTTNGTFNGATTASSDADYEFSITKENEYYDYPTQLVSVTVGGTTLKREEYTYDKETGRGSIPKEKITGNIDFVVICQGKYYDNAIVNVTNGIGGNYNQPHYGEPCAIGFEPNDGYTLEPSTISVTIDGKDYTGFSYDSSKGYILIPGEAVTGQIVVNATCVSTAEPNTYKVTQAGRPGVGYKFEGEATATEGEDYTFKFSLEEHYHQQEELRVSINNKFVSFASVDHDHETGISTYVIPGSEITGDIVIYIYCETEVDHLVNHGFIDIDSSTSHLEEVYELIDSGISKGWDVGNDKKEFRPYAEVARADMAAFLKRFAYTYCADSSIDSFAPSEEDWATFTDVVAAKSEQDQYHQDDILWLAKSGISKGWTMKDGTKQFRPFEKVTRADMAAFLRRLAAAYDLGDAKDWEPSEEDWATFSDLTRGDDYHQEDILWLAHAEISTGFSDGTFRPFETVKRCDMAAFLIRLGNLK